MFRELFVIFHIIQIIKQMQYFVLMQIYEHIRTGQNMTCSTTSRKRRRQSSQGGDNLYMAGHSEMEGSRCNVIMKKHAPMQFEINITTDSFHLYFVMTINFLQMDREWMYVGNRVSQRFIEGLVTFLETATEYNKPENMSDVHYISCPCIDCCNE
jgi:hypothetical protein